MAENTTYQKIPRVVETQDDLDFGYLKELGLEYIQSIGGSLWTDFNVHDPGVTLLEMLCYAISDLSARIDMPIEDLLTPAAGEFTTDQFHRASEILPTCPVTALDYRKLFLEIDGIRNCWILPFNQTMYANCKTNQISYDQNDFDAQFMEYSKPFNLKGLNSIYIDYEPDHFEQFNGDETAIESEKTNIRQQVWEKYHANRNLCEDLVEIKEVKEKKVSICANIELEKTADKNEVHARVEKAIEDYFSPAVKYYSLQQMLDRGYRTDEIFEGPLLTKGFIDDEELEETELRSSVRLSDIVRIIMGVNGVSLINSINLRNCDFPDGDQWVICIDEFTKPVLAPTYYDEGETPDCDMTSVFNYYKDVLPITFNRSEVDRIKQELYDAELEEQMKAMLNNTLQIPEGTFRSPSETTTIQNDFPMTYGIGVEGLSANTGEARRAKALQFKAYITVFDQILATYFSHLGKVRDLFAMSSGTNPTYFTQAVKDIKDFDKIVNDYPTNNDEELSEKLVAFLDDNLDRRNEILDHLIARFAEKFSDYTFLMTELYGDAADELIVQAKEQFLQDYVELSGNRFKAYNMQGPDTWDTDNVSGTQKRIARLGGLRDFTRRNLSTTHVSIQKVPLGTDPETYEYQWTVKNASDDVTIQHITPTNSTRSASRDLYRAIFLLINCNEMTISNAFDAGVSDGQEIEYVRIGISGSDYSFTVVDVDGSGSDIGVSITYASENDLKTALLDFISYLKNDATEEGIYLVEHILLRPNLDTPADAIGAEEVNPPTKSYLPICAEDCESGCSIDPYSFRVSIILPGYTRRMADVDFRMYMENLIANEIPAHILPRICWIGYRDGEHVEVDDEENPINELVDFEASYANMLESIRISRESDTVIMDNVEEEVVEFDTTGKSNLIEFIGEFTRLHTIHHVGRLHNCESEGIEDSVILGRTNLGSL
ncbi:MAG: hypothetical protein NXI10_11925 [bacterium]|nr:hypothetical protein [bacterium]